MIIATNRVSTTRCPSRSSFDAVRSAPAGACAGRWRACAPHRAGSHRTQKAGEEGVRVSSLRWASGQFQEDLFQRGVTVRGSVVPGESPRATKRPPLMITAWEHSSVT